MRGFLRDESGEPRNTLNTRKASRDKVGFPRIPCIPRLIPAVADNGRVVPPLLLWRRGQGRGGPRLLTCLAPLNLVRTRSTASLTSPGMNGMQSNASLPTPKIFQQVTVPIYLGCWRRTTTSSPWPSPPKEERETVLRPVETEIPASTGLPLPSPCAF